MALVLVVSVVSIAPVTGAVSEGTAAVPHGGQDTTRDRGANNLTTKWEDQDCGEGEDPEPDVCSPAREGMTPGNKDIDWFSFAPGFPVDYEPIGNITTAFPQQDVWQYQNDCKVTQAAAFGIDRDNDGRPEDSSDDGPKANTYTDVTLIDKFKVNKNFTDDENRNYTWLDFWNEGEAAGGFGDNSVNVYEEDEIVAKYTDCYNAPEEPGWYRFYGSLNGTTDGDPEDSDGGDWRTESWFGDDDDEIGATYSHWWWVCECEDTEEAVETLGTPPDYTPAAETTIGAPNAWHEETELAPLYHPGSKDGGDGTATPTESTGETETPTATESTGETATPTETATEDTGDDTGGDDTGGDDTGGEDDGSDGDSPGFGAVAALVALLAAALLALRRR